MAGNGYRHTVLQGIALVSCCLFIRSRTNPVQRKVKVLSFVKEGVL